MNSQLLLQALHLLLYPKYSLWECGVDGRSLVNAVERSTGGKNELSSWKGQILL